ncbi:MAG: hypothetical protein IPQ16_04505 [Geobacteraceae bacterium]|nr:hypothetical protein [Geobacteraceae bacterium]
MNGKTIFIFIAAVAFFTLAATYRFHDSAHAMGMIKKGGGMARHPALLDKDRDSYVMIATAGVLPPYKGNARVVLEGDPTLTATFHNSEVPFDLGVFRHPAFRDNIYYDLRPKDRIALWVKIKRRQEPAVATIQQGGRETEPLCPQCEPDDKTLGAEKKASVGQMAGSELKHHEKENISGQTSSLQDNRQPAKAGLGNRWEKKAAGALPAKGPAVAFYDVATKEPLLRIPIRFTGDKGGGADEH